MKNILLLGLTICIFSYPVSSRAKEITFEELQKQCVELRETNDGKTYIPVAGELINAEFTYVPEDCFPNDLKNNTCKKTPPTYSGLIKNTNIFADASDVTFSTNLVSKENQDLFKKVVRNGYYGFCGTSELATLKNAPRFYIEHIKTFQPIKK